MTCSIFIKSFPKDFAFLAYCLRSIQKFARGFSETVVLIPDDSDLRLTQERVVKVHEPASNGQMHGAGYVYQQVLKMNADKYCTSDFICHMDSDTVFTKPVTPLDLMVASQIKTYFTVEGTEEVRSEYKPLWLMTPFVEIMPTDKNLPAHFESIKAFSGIPPEFEYMRRHSQVIPRWAYGCFRDYVQTLHGQSFEKWAMSQKFRGVTEFNLIGHFLHREFPNFIHFHDTRFGVPEGFVHQEWSWNGLTPEMRNTYEKILA